MIPIGYELQDNLIILQVVATRLRPIISYSLMWLLVHGLRLFHCNSADLTIILRALSILYRLKLEMSTYYRCNSILSPGLYNKPAIEAWDFIYDNTSNGRLLRLQFIFLHDKSLSSILWISLDLGSLIRVIQWTRPKFNTFWPLKGGYRSLDRGGVYNILTWIW